MMDSTLTVSNNSQWVTSRWKLEMPPQHFNRIEPRVNRMSLLWQRLNRAADATGSESSRTGEETTQFYFLDYREGLWFATPFGCVHECRLAVFIQKRSPAVYALVKIGGAAVPSLIEAVKSGAQPQRIHALRALAEIRDHRAI
jgi:hypothetical protein